MRSWCNIHNSALLKVCTKLGVRRWCLYHLHCDQASSSDVRRKCVPCVQEPEFCCPLSWHLLWERTSFHWENCSRLMERRLHPLGWGRQPLWGTICGGEWGGRVLSDWLGWGHPGRGRRPWGEWSGGLSEWLGVGGRVVAGTQDEEGGLSPGL